MKKKIEVKGLALDRETSRISEETCVAGYKGTGSGHKRCSDSYRKALMPSAW